MKAPSKIKSLVEKFSTHYDSYKSTFYNEAQLRQEFLDPFFEALGWDINNEQGLAEAYKDVIHEDAIKIGGLAKAPDYSFRIGGIRKFFVEAKKPSINVKKDASPAFQLRRYAWSAKLPISILTDFEELVVYDTKNRPYPSDPASKYRIDYFHYSEFVDRWEEIAGIFSKDAILKGAFDNYTKNVTTKRGASEVDNEFLKEIEKWRELLAKDIAKNNLGLSSTELNYSVQKTIDRIIFLRICEDRGIEDEGKLMSLLNRSRLYPVLTEVFEEADTKYNSGLFHFRKEKNETEQADALTPQLNLSDSVLKEIIKNLYYPYSPYEFSVLPAEVLGQVYEQFLGKVIRLTDGHRAVVEDKPEVKKAGGVYYTPTYIVSYIVKSTVGKLLAKKTPNQVSKLKILDPACGSGSFLLGAYEYLLKWHLDYYIEHLTNKYYKGKNPLIYQIRTGEWRLTTSEKRRILLNNIFGVDIDSQAVEVTKLSLLLKVLEGENQETLQQQLKIFHERALPSLGSNIKCGNSLIGSDIYSQVQLDLFDEQARYRINAFDWEWEFKEVMDAGGFDAVIGNPPYIRIQAMKEWAPVEVEFYKQKYKSASSGNYDIYVVFVEKGLQLLNKKGLLGYILPHKFFNAQYGEATRRLVSDGGRLSKIVHFGDIQIFKNATTYTCLLFLNNKKSSHFEFEKVVELNKWMLDNNSEKTVIKMPKSGAWNFVTGGKGELFKKLQENKTNLGDISTNIFQGIVTSADPIYILEIKEENAHSYKAYSKFLQEDIDIEKKYVKPFIKRRTLTQFEQPPHSHVLIFPYLKGQKVSWKEILEEAPNTAKYLKKCREFLRNREKGRMNGDNWFMYVYPKNLFHFSRRKIIVQVISKIGKYVIDDNSLYFTGGGNGPYYGILIKEEYALEYILALLNSNLLDFYLHQISSPFRGGYWSYGKRFIEQLPIRTIDFSNEEEKEIHDKIVELVKSLTELNKNLIKAVTDHEKELIKRQISAFKSQIDKMVYDLYGLTDEEIAIVERDDNKN